MFESIRNEKGEIAAAMAVVMLLFFIAMIVDAPDKTKTAPITNAASQEAR